MLRAEGWMVTLMLRLLGYSMAIGPSPAAAGAVLTLRELSMKKKRRTWPT